MPHTPHKRLRRLGTAFLGAAVLMLICGLTILEARLRGLALVAYWCGCFLVVGLAALVALLDLFLTRREIRQAQRALLEESFLGFDSRTRPSPPSPGSTGRPEQND